jgi:hypothetical protein
VDKYAHDMRMALVDAKGQLRGLYNVMASRPEQAQEEKQRLERDLL